MTTVVDTGIVGASLSRRRRPRFEAQVGLLGGHHVFLAAVTLREPSIWALVAQWGDTRRAHLDRSIRGTTVVPVSDHRP